MKILIIKPSAMGDVIHGMPLINDIRMRYPDAEIAWLVNDTFVPLLEMTSGIDKIIPFSRSSLKKSISPLHFIRELKKVILEIRSFQPDITIDIQCLLRSALFALFSGAKKRIGLSTGREGSVYFYTDIISINNINMHAIDKNRLTIEKISENKIDSKADFPITIPKKTFEKVTAQLPFSLEDKKFIILSPESNWLSKSWPEDHFTILAEKLIIKTEYYVVVTGVKKPTFKWQELTKKYPGKIILLQGSTNLKELAALFSLADYSVTNDSGPMHLSVAVNTHSFVIIGPTNALRTGPYRNCTVIKTDMKCSPCYKRKCPFTNDTGKCLQEISPDHIFSSIMKEKNNE